MPYNTASSFLSFVLNIPMVLCGSNLSKSRKETSEYPEKRENLTERFQSLTELSEFEKKEAGVWKKK